MIPKDLSPNEDEESDSVEVGIQSDIANRQRQEPIASANNSLCLLPVLLVMLQHLTNELDLKNKENDRLKKENDELRNELRLKQNMIKPFPLLSLPDEIIGYIYSFLSIKDRMKARMCKRLDNVEYEHKYYVPELLIHERETDDRFRFNNHYITSHKQYFVLLKEKVYSINFFKRIIQNARFGYLALNMPCRDEFHWELYNLIKECDIGKLALRFTSQFHSNNDVMNDSFMFGLMNACSKLELDNPARMTAEGMHKVYTCIMERSTKLHSIGFGYPSKVLLKKFLSLVGIIFEGGNLLSDRDIEAYEHIINHNLDPYYEDLEEEVISIHKHVFDGNLEMKFGEEQRDDYGWLSLKWHNTEEDLEKAKTTKGFVRLDLTAR